MYSTISRLRGCLVIGVVFSLFLGAFYSYQQVWAQVYTSTGNPDINYYVNDNAKVYIDFPADWTLTEQTNGLLLSKSGMRLELSILTPVPGGDFSVNTPIEQVAQSVINNNRNEPNTQLIYHSPLTMKGIPAYQLGYNIIEGGTPMIEDYFILINQGKLYEAAYIVPQSADQQNLLARDLMINSLSVGDSYDNHNQQIAAAGADLASAQKTTDMINCIGSITSSFTVGDPNWKIYDPNCDQTHYSQ